MKSGHQSYITISRRYLQTSHETLTIKWWSDHAKVYPTLARVALDVLPMQASSVPCERIFSAAKLIATDCRARLSPTVFEELQVLKFAWRGRLSDFAALNTEEIEEIEDIDDVFVCRLAEENEVREWELEEEAEMLTQCVN